MEPHQLLQSWTEEQVQEVNHKAPNGVLGFSFHTLKDTTPSTL